MRGLNTGRGLEGNETANQTHGQTHKRDKHECENDGVTGNDVCEIGNPANRGSYDVTYVGHDIGHGHCSCGSLNTYFLSKIILC